MGLAKIKDSDAGAGQPLAEQLPNSPESEMQRRPPPLFYLPGDHKDYPWSSLPWKGITKKTLFFDQVSGATLELAKFERGASFPEHHHTSLEATFVLKGQLRQEPGSSLAEGSFFIAEAGEIQPSVIAETETILYRYFAGVPVYILSDGSTFITRRDGSVSAAGRLDVLRKKGSTNIVSP